MLILKTQCNKVSSYKNGRLFYLKGCFIFRVKQFTESAKSNLLLESDLLVMDIFQT